MVLHMLSVGIGIFVTVVCHLFHGEQMNMYGDFCLYCTYIANRFLWIYHFASFSF